MTTYLLGLYLKLNFLLAAAFALWLLTRKLASLFGFELAHARQLRLARCLFLGLLLAIPFSLAGNALLPGWLSGVAARSGTWLAGEMTVAADIDRGLDWQFALGSMTLPLSLPLLGLLLVGFVLQFRRLARQVAKLRHIIDTAVEWKSVRHIQLLVSAAVGTPFSTSALGRRQVVLPEQLLESPRNLRLAVKHELQHLRNGDLHWVILLEAVKTLCFWNPAIHLWHNEFDCLQEFACDEVLVNARRVSPKAYGTCLLEVASANVGTALVASSNMVPRFSLLTNQHSQLKRRIVMLGINTNNKHAIVKALVYGFLVSSGLFSASLFVFAAEPGEARPVRREYLPLVVKQPQYPRSALDAKMEGWAQVQFTVDEFGNVVDPEVVDSCAGPTIATCTSDDMFVQVSLEAIKDFKFEPRLEAGAPVKTPGVQYVFRFNLQE
jgi:TonB family protein